VVRDRDTGLMDIRDRLLGPVATIVDRERDELAVDFGDLIRKLILSERFILQSNRLREIPLLVQKFGYDGVVELLRSGRMQILLDALSVGSIGHIAGDLRPGKTPLPLGSYSFGMLRLQLTRDTVHKDLEPIDAIPGLRNKQAQKLRKLVVEQLAELPETRGGRTIDAFHKDLEANAPILRTSVALALRQQYGRRIDPNEFELRVDRLDENDWRTETDLGTKARLSEERVHKVVERGLLGAGGLNVRIEYMQIFNAVAGFQVDELPLMEDKLGFLARQLDPDAQLDRFERVIELADLPDADPDPNVQDADMVRLLEVLSDQRTVTFRDWLRQIDSLEDREVLAEIHKLRDLVSSAVRSPAGKTVRFLGTTAAGIVLPPVGIALSGLDTFLTEKIVPEPGPTAFLGQLYSSVFPTAT
jgi:hypothetical protein